MHPDGPLARAPSIPIMSTAAPGASAVMIPAIRRVPSDSWAEANQACLRVWPFEFAWRPCRNSGIKKPPALVTLMSSISPVI